MNDKDTRISEYAREYTLDYGFEREMVQSRQRAIVNLIRRLRPSTIVEIGCGRDLLSRSADLSLEGIMRWIIVEPANQFAETAIETHAGDSRFTVVMKFAEDATGSVRMLLPVGADLVVASGVLHEVPDPLILLSAAKEMVAAGGTIHVNVPNAYSLHRRLARAMGLIKNEFQFSRRNEALRQFRVYDNESLRSDVLAAGLRVAEEGGYFIKPFSHQQMEAIAPVLSADVLDGLWKLGHELPQLASEIFVNAIAGS